MFDKELYEIVLKDRESKLNDAKAQNPVNQDEVDNLTKEVNYLKATLIRYKIAVLLGLSNDSSYTSINYLGIEEEDVNDFNLNSTDLAEYNRSGDYSEYDNNEKFMEFLKKYYNIYNILKN